MVWLVFSFLVTKMFWQEKPSGLGWIYPRAPGCNYGIHEGFRLRIPDPKNVGGVDPRSRSTTTKLALKRGNLSNLPYIWIVWYLFKMGGISWSLHIPAIKTNGGLPGLPKPSGLVTTLPPSLATELRCVGPPQPSGFVLTEGETWEVTLQKHGNTQPRGGWGGDLIEVDSWIFRFVIFLFNKKGVNCSIWSSRIREGYSKNNMEICVYIHVYTYGSVQRAWYTFREHLGFLFRVLKLPCTSIVLCPKHLSLQPVVSFG